MIRVAIGQYGVVDVNGITPLEMKLYCNKTHVALIIREASQTIVKRWTYNLAKDETVFTFNTEGLTYAKVMDPFATTPTIVGYKADGVYTMLADGALVKVQNTPSGIDGMAVNLVAGSNYTAGWIYRDSEGVCRNQNLKRVAYITGDMNLGYNYQTHIISDAVELIDGSNPN